MGSLAVGPLCVDCLPRADSPVTAQIQTLRRCGSFDNRILNCPRNLPPPLASWLGEESTMPTPSDHKDEPLHYDADKARGAEIILTKRRNRVIFIAGLVGFVVLALVLNWFA